MCTRHADLAYAATDATSQSPAESTGRDLLRCRTPPVPAADLQRGGAQPGRMQQRASRRRPAVAATRPARTLPPQQVPLARPASCPTGALRLISFCTALPAPCRREEQAPLRLPSTCISAL